MLFLCGIHFALHSGEEHHSLQLSQFELIVPKDGGSARLVYTENYSKNNQGGLQHRKIQPKCVTYYANDSNPDRCLVCLYQLYVSHRPARCSSLLSDSFTKEDRKPDELELPQITKSRDLMQIRATVVLVTRPLQFLLKKPWTSPSIA